MEPEEKKLFLADMGLEESGLDRLIQACYSLLGLISYLTAGKPEVRAHLNDLGFVAGSDVQVITDMMGNLIVNVKETRVAISKEMAAKIMV